MQHRASVFPRHPLSAIPRIRVGKRRDQIAASIKEVFVKPPLGTDQRHEIREAEHLDSMVMAGNRQHASIGAEAQGFG